MNDGVSWDKLPCQTAKRNGLNDRRILQSKGLFRISCWGGWYFLGKVPIKNAYLPPRYVPEAFQGSRVESRERGIKGGGGIARKGYFA